MANQFLSLALFIMLLSFFIVLNTLSNFQEMKSRPVLKSLAIAFSSQEIGEEEAPSIEETVKQSFKKGEALDNINGLFEAQIAGFEAKQNRFGTEMHIRVPLRHLKRGIMSSNGGSSEATKAYDGIEREDDKALQSLQSGFFLPTLVSLLKAEDTRVSYRMDMVLNVPYIPSKMQNQSPKRLQEPSLSIGEIARHLEEAGLPKKLYSMGLAQGKEAYVDLFFRRYERFDPLGGNKEGSSLEDNNGAGLDGSELQEDQGQDTYIDNTILPGDL